MTDTQKRVVEVARAHGRIYRCGATAYATKSNGALISIRINSRTLPSLVRAGTMQLVRAADHSNYWFELTEDR